MTIYVRSNETVHGFVYSWTWIISQDGRYVVSGTEDTEEAARKRAAAVLDALTGPLPVS